MKHLNKTILIVLGLVILSACSKSPKAIDYGNDGCHFCKMTIVDKIHGSELITDKGKVFKFDAAECMLNYMAENKDLPIATLVTNYYEGPTEFIETKDAVFLISNKLPSPMGANLTAFKTRESAEKVQAEKEGELYTWDSLKAYLKR